VRPLRLTVEGFTCFKERQAPLDFSELDLFAIAGPTGAGKSSLLDAIIFALYGRVPRMRKGYSELISLGRDRMSVMLDFRMGRREFRVTRTGRRGRSAEAQLDELVNGKERSVAGGVHGVDNEVVRLLGLRYEAFTQAVVLPQGEFARFLKSQPRERREILRDLLRLQIYEWMRKRAAECTKELELKLRGVDERLSEDYGEAKPERVEELRRQVRVREKENRKGSEELALLQKKLEEMRARYQKTRELEEKRARLAEIGKREVKNTADEAKLSAARRVAPLVPLMEAAAASERRADEDRKRAGGALEELGRVRVRHEEASRKLDASRRQAEELPVLQERIRALDELKGLLAPRQSAARRRDETRKRWQELERKTEGLEGEEKKARDRVKGFERDVETASKKLAGLRYDEELDRRLDAARDAASSLAAHRKTATQALSEANQAEERTSGEQQMVSDKKAAVEKSRSSLRERTRMREKVEADRRKAEKEHAAAHLRGELAAGMKCPVCEQPVSKPPPAIQVALLDVTASRLEEARSAEERARSLLEEERQSEAEARAALKAAKSEAVKARKKSAELQKVVERSERELEKSVGSRVAKEKGSTLEARILSAVGRIAKERERYERMEKEREKADKELLKARSELERLTEESRRLEQLSREATSRTKEAEDELADLEEKIAKVAADSDPVKERDRLAERKGKIERSGKAAEQTERKTGAEFSSAKKAVEEAERTVQESTRQLLEAQKKLKEAIQSAGIKEERTIREAALSAKEMKHIEEEITSYRQELHATQQRARELESELGGEEVSEQAKRHAEEELDLKRRDYEDGIKKKAELEQEAKELERRMERAAQLTAQKDSLGREFSIYQRLASDLRSENFQAYLLEEAFRELVTGASVRLENLSGRYSLEYRQDAFHVLDHDNARERRSADTLSGGETFLASLALALELSEQVQRAAGAVNLDSLFIDEGFGTLDPETLDTVAAAIESLHVGGRMVGIITHLPELTERLPACIRVEKHAEGSRVRQEFI
jgi:exonuclease SbcC